MYTLAANSGHYSCCTFSLERAGTNGCIPSGKWLDPVYVFRQERACMNVYKYIVRRMGSMYAVSQEMAGTYVIILSGNSSYICIHPATRMCVCIMPG
jgi:hypothetical protein